MKDYTRELALFLLDSDCTITGDPKVDIAKIESYIDAGVNMGYFSKENVAPLKSTLNNDYRIIVVIYKRIVAQVLNNCAKMVEMNL